MEIIYFSIGIGVFVFSFVFCFRLVRERRELEIRLNKVSQENASLKSEVLHLREFKEKYYNLTGENNRYKELVIKLQTQLEEKEKNDAILKESFENLVNRVLEASSTKLSNESSKILAPLNNELREFKNRIEDLTKNEAERISILLNEIQNIKKLNVKLSEEADNLAKTLKGDIKKAGIWGEMVLERILEMSGLREGYEFKREKVLDGGRPDVIVYLPNNRAVIIDSKVSLKAYSEYIAGDEEALKRLRDSIKKHIDTLSKKDYEKLLDNSLDFVLMFVPIESALITVLEYDPTLFEYAFQKRVILTSPTTLLATLRSIELSWRYEKQAKNIEEVVKMADKLYNKVRLFVEEFDKIGSSLDSAKKSFEVAKNRLADGKDNIISQLETLKEKSGIKPKKVIKYEEDLKE
jgi:DNA recombination protein RmuC